MNLFPSVERRGEREVGSSSRSPPALLNLTLSDSGGAYVPLSGSHLLLSSPTKKPPQGRGARPLLPCKAELLLLVQCNYFCRPATTARLRGFRPLRRQRRRQASSEHLDRVRQLENLNHRLVPGANEAQAVAAVPVLP